MIEPREISVSIALDRCLHQKQYGKVRRNGKTFTRNYGRELKNGKGLDFSDLVQENIFRENLLLKELLKKRVFK